jgi:hypothetical protein
MKVLKLFDNDRSGTCLEERRNIGEAASSPSQAVAGGGVTAKVILLNPKGAEGPRFVLDPHSVNLDAYDSKNIAVLRDDARNSYVPVALENKGSGHHREASVSFPKISPESERIELVIKDVAGVEQRTFVWKLDQKINVNLTKHRRIS